jgi:hypothetical protein
MTKSQKFAELLFNSSLDQEIKDFILDNLESYSEDKINDIMKILEDDIKNTENILKLTEIKFQNEKNKFDKESKKLELEVLKTKMENK